MPPRARIYYSFHPYSGLTFKVLHLAGGKPEQVTLERSAAKTFTVPLWMLQPEAALLQVSANIEIPHTVLLEIIDLLTANCSALKPLSDALEHADGSTQL